MSTTFDASYSVWHVGVGRGTSIALSSAGWNVVLTARRIAELEETRKRCAAPDNCLIVAGEITDEAFVKILFQQAVEKFGEWFLNLSPTHLRVCDLILQVESIFCSTYVHLFVC